MGWLAGLMRNHWLVLCLGCGGWFVVHTWVLMFNDIRTQRRKLALRRRSLARTPPIERL